MAVGIVLALEGLKMILWTVIKDLAMVLVVVKDTEMDLGVEVANMAMQQALVDLAMIPVDRTFVWRLQWVAGISEVLWMVSPWISGKMGVLSSQQLHWMKSRDYSRWGQVPLFRRYLLLSPSVPGWSVKIPGLQSVWCPVEISQWEMDYRIRR